MNRVEVRGRVVPERRAHHAVLVGDVREERAASSDPTDSQVRWMTPAIST